MPRHPRTRDDTYGERDAMDDTSIWTKFAGGDEDARQRVLTEHLGLVHFVARQLARGLASAAEYDELVSCGTIGLMSALENFEPARGLAFSTFAAPRIRGAILDELRRHDIVQRSVRKKSRDIGAAKESLARQGGGTPSDRETAAALGIDLDTLWKWEADCEGSVHVPLDHGTSNDDESSGPSPSEMLAGADDYDVEESMTFDMEVSVLRDALQNLTEQERIVLTLYFYEELKLHEIATILELTESRVSQIRSKALGKLRTTMKPLREQVA